MMIQPGTKTKTKEKARQSNNSKLRTKSTQRMTLQRTMPKTTVGPSCSMTAQPKKSKQIRRQRKTKRSLMMR